MSDNSVSNPIRVLLVDDHVVVRVGLRAILADDARIQVVGEAATGQQALDLAKKLEPQIVVLDLRLTDLPGDEVCRRLKASTPPPAVVILTSFGDDQSVLSCLAAGADGYLLKDFERSDLASALVRVAKGGWVLDPFVARQIVGAVRTPTTPLAISSLMLKLEPLTAQESRVLELAAAGRANKEIATSLGLGEGTVRNYLTSIFAKLGVQNRTEAAAHWHRSKSGSGPGGSGTRH